ncbi:amino acid adenylation domain-containing protein [Bacillus atrophaeus]|nr:amino acid adenylation domain-containing protein [Bacillus atrophaeus]
MSTLYNVTGAIQIEGGLDVERMKNALYSIVCRHESLRTSFTMHENEIVQKIHYNIDFTAEIEEITENEAERYINDFVKPFDLSIPPLIRSKILKMTENSYLLLIDMHHIISDGYSMKIFLDEIIKEYQGIPLADIKFQYKDYALWQQNLLGTLELQKQKEYWSNKYSDDIPQLKLIPDYQTIDKLSEKGGYISFIIDDELKRKLNKLALETETTVHMILLSSYYILLSKYSGQKDIVVGIPTIGRNHEDLNNIVGMFVNTLPIRNSLKEGTLFLDFLNEVKENLLIAYENQDYPFEQMIDDISKKRNEKRIQLFNTFFAFQNLDINPITVEGLTFTPYEVTNKNAMYDLIFDVQQNRSALEIKIVYKSDLLKNETIECMKNHYIQILHEVTKNSSRKLETINLISEQEKDWLLHQLNNSDVNYPEKRIVDLFEEQVEKTPDNIAIKFGADNVTYKNLNIKANQFAWHLKKLKLKHEDVIAIICDHSIESVIAILGTLKIGAAYLPIDVKIAENRLLYILENSNASLIVTKSCFKSLVSSKQNILFIDELSLENEKTVNPFSMCKGDHLAYIIYTSGTTGKPKGVMVEHKSLSNRLQWCKSKYNLSPQDTSLQLYPFSFDAFVTSFFTPIISGATVIIPNELERKDPVVIKNYMKDNQVTYIDVVPSFFQVIMDNLSAEDIRTLNLVVLGGEKVSFQHVKTLKEKNSKTKLINAYGPTEGTVLCTCSQLDLSSDRITIGKPVANSKIYIVDQSGRLQPTGVSGELCISGNLSRGYVNNPELTKQKFVSSPFYKDEILYKTGDLARILPSGEIEYLGRVDDQVKISGYRIEPSEIEKALLSFSQIESSYVTSYKEKYLIAYYVSELPIETKAIKTKLRTYLPEYMIPYKIIHLEKMPLTQTGKVDRSSLPNSELNDTQKAGNTLMNHTIDLTLTDIWKHVFNYEVTDYHADFFEVGGNSLQAAILLTKINKAFDIELQLKDIFEHSSFFEMSNLIREKRDSNKEAKLIDACKLNQSEKDTKIFQVSSNQRGMMALQQMNSESTAYNMPGAIILEGGTLDEIKLQEAIDILIERHEILRTSFTWIEDNPYQVINHNVSLNINVTACTEAEAAVFIKNYCRPFNLEIAPLFRINVLKTATEKFILLFDAHHIIWDGLSMNIFLKELTSIYNGDQLPELTAQYKDFAIWQANYAESEFMSSQKQYWKQIYSKEPSLLNLPLDYPRSQSGDFKGSQLDFQLNVALSSSLRKTANKLKTTMFNLMLASFNLFLSKYSNQTDIVIGTPAAGRMKEAWQQTMGMYTNTLALRNHPLPNKTFRHFVKEVHDHTIEALANQFYPYEELVNELQLERYADRNPLFDVMFVMNPFDDGNLLFNNLTCTPIEIKEKQSKFDLTLFVSETTDSNITLTFEYPLHLFEESTIQYFAKSFINLLQQLEHKSNENISDIQVLSNAQRNEFVYTNNDTAVDHREEMTFIKLFEESVLQHGDKTAVMCGNHSFTYSELNERANQYANLLYKKGIVPQDKVSIIMENSIETVVGILSILKAGAVYIPIDPLYPAERIEYILHDSQAKLILTKTKTQNLHFDLDFIEIDMNKQLNEKKENIESLIVPDDLAYIIYTSGTTGKPKGSMIKHKGLTNYIVWADKLYNDDNQTDFPLYSSISFDLTVTSIFTPLISGRKIIVYPGENKGELIEKILDDNQAGIIKLTPTHLKLLLNKEHVTSSVRKLIVGGEALSTDLAIKVHDVFGGQVKIYNEYGPTETVVGCMFYEFNPIEDTGASVPIGYPADNVQVYILDKHLNPVPYNVTGEIYISGAGVSAGYLNRKELTKQKFIDNPFIKGVKMFKSGDLAKRLSNGAIVYEGRLDNQVKVKGYRIELDEIENYILSIEGIKEACAAPFRMDNDLTLVAYYVADKLIKPLDMRAALTNRLPAYMVPMYFEQVHNLPVTNNGKVNYSQLPDPRSNLQFNSQYIPANGKEEILLRAWQEVFQSKEIGVTDNFFLIGGDSIKAIQIAANLNKYDLKFDIKDIFKFPTITELSPYVKTQKIKAEQGEVTGHVPLTPIQHWFFDHQFENKEHWNQSVLLTSKNRVDEKALHSVIHHLTHHHDALRIIFKENTDGSFSQWNQRMSEENTKLNFFNIQHLDENLCLEYLKEQSENLQMSFDIETGPLFKAALFRAKNNDFLLLIAHHLIIDAVSWRILLEDLEKFYLSLINKNNIKFERKTTSYKSWAEKLVRYTQNSNELKDEKVDYWDKIMDYADCFRLKTDCDLSNGFMFQNKISTLTFTEKQTQNIMNVVNKVYRTNVQDILLAALGLAVKNWAGQSKQYINLEGHGRDEFVDGLDVSRTVGWFTSLYPVVIDVTNTVDLSHYIKTLKETIRKIPKKGIGFGLLNYLDSSNPKVKRKEPINSEINFNYLGFVDEDSKDKIFSIAHHDIGYEIGKDNKRIYKLTIQAFIKSGQVVVEFHYNSAQFKEGTISHLNMLLEKYIQDIISHSLSTESELTPYDIGNRELSLDEFETIIDVIETLN